MNNKPRGTAVIGDKTGLETLRRTRSGSLRAYGARWRISTGSCGRHDGQRSSGRSMVVLRVGVCRYCGIATARLAIDDGGLYSSMDFAGILSAAASCVGE